MRTRLTAIVAIGFSAAAALLAAPAHASPARAAAPPAPAAWVAQILHPSPAAATPVTYRLRKGQYLAWAAVRFCHDNRDWLGIWHATRPRIANPDQVAAGTAVTIACNHRGPAWHPPAVTSYRPASRGGYGTARRVRYRATAASPAYRAPAGGSYSGSGGFERCVIARESGGNSQVMNSSGHYGLYQFSSSTWAAYGGSRADFGHASVAEQRQVFDHAIAAGGQSNWSAYDGC